MFIWRTGIPPGACADCAIAPNSLPPSVGRFYFALRHIAEKRNLTVNKVEPGLIISLLGKPDALNRAVSPYAILTQWEGCSGAPVSVQLLL